MASPPIKFIHANDVEWIIALWLAKHGGDPGPDTKGDFIPERSVQLAAAQIIRGLAQHLPAEKAKAIGAAVGH